MKVKSVIKLCSKFIGDNLPTILSVAAGIGLIGSVTSAIIETPIAKEKIITAKKNKAEILERETEDQNTLQNLYGDKDGTFDLKKIKLTPWEYIKILAPTYWKTAVSTLLTGTCIFAANRVNKKRLLAAIAALSLKDKQFKDLEDKIKEFFGDKKFEEIKTEIAKDVAMNIPDENDVIQTGHGNQLFYEPIMQKYFRSSMNSVKEGWIDIKDRLYHDGEFSLSDLYYNWDIPLMDTWYPDRVRWIYNPDKPVIVSMIDFKFATYDRTGEHVAVIDYRFMPELG